MTRSQPMERLKKAVKNNGIFLTALTAIVMVNLCFDFFYIKTGSMEPELPVGSVVMVAPNAKPKIGDIFAYENHGSTVIHRIVGMEGDGYVFQGDANPSPDGAVVEKSQIIGKAVARIRFLAPVIRAIQSY